jgi:Rieske Fe-S protein
MEGRIPGGMNLESERRLAETPVSRCVGCLSRRLFLTQSAVAAAAAWLAACGDGQIGGGGAITDPGTSTTITVSAFPGLATVGTLVLVDGLRAVKRTGASTFVAFSRACTHEGFPVTLSRSGFFCNNHSSQFDNNGHVTVGPATRDLTKLVTAYDPVTDILTIG